MNILKTTLAVCVALTLVACAQQEEVMEKDMVVEETSSSKL